MANTLFSIVIPVYNTCKKYLLDCIESVERQTYKNYEVVIVDDCSNSKETIDTLNSFDKYKVIHHLKNSGIVSSRETGVNNANGEYILYLDSDDILNNNALLEINNIIEKYNSDVIMFQTPRFTNNLSEVVPLDSFVLEEGPIKKDDVVEQICKLQLKSISDKCARKELLDFSDDKLDKNIINGEDLQQSTALILKANNIYFTKKEICYYRTTNYAKDYYDVSRVYDVNYMIPPYKMLFVDNDKYKKYLGTYKKACVNDVIYNAFRICNAKLDNKTKNGLLDKLVDLEISKLLISLNEKIPFSSQFVFNLLINKYYFIIKILAKIYPMPQ